MSILGNAVGCYSPIGKTFIIEDENGNQITGVVTESLQVLDASPDDVKIGKTFAGDNGIEQGIDTKTYRTCCGYRAIPSGSPFSIPLSEHNSYDYTQLQCIMAPFNTSINDSCAADKIVLHDSVYMTNSADKIADVTKNSQTQSIDLNITNTSDGIYFIYYFTYREEN